jgi:hypothetical protein
MTLWYILVLVSSLAVHESAKFAKLLLKVPANRDQHNQTPSLSTGLSNPSTLALNLQCSRV